MKVRSTMNGVSTVAIPKLGCGLDQMSWQEVVKLLFAVFAYANVQVVVNILDENGVHVISAGGDAKFYADDEIERNGKEYFHENRELKHTLLRNLNPVNRPVMKNSQFFVRKNKILDLSITTSNTSPRNLQILLKVSIFRTQTLQMKNWYS